MGQISFKTGTSGVIFDVQFTNGYCVNMKRIIEAQGNGLKTILIISPEKLSINGVEFDNNWVE